MDYEYSELVAKAQQWAERAMTEDRLDRKQAQPVLEIDARTPDSLFTNNEARPLIVAFMGGTGVGKSSLLNRLAGQDIAKTGIERPTSREVTLYHHVSVSIQQLPAGLPVEKIKINRHHDESKQNIIWIDMPDFDSVELENRRLVLEWLPHIDVLLYVVSPERYRDYKAWQLLLSEGNRHAWLFILNQWDRGQQSQLDDFRRQLSKAGFDEPMVFKTICTGQATHDDFQDLVRQLELLAKGHIVRELEQRGMEVRVYHLRRVLQPLLAHYDEDKFQALHDFFQQQWRATRDLLKQAFDWPLHQLAQVYAEKGGGRPDIQIWDQWAQSRFNDLLDEIVFKAAQLQIPVKPLKSALDPVRSSVEKTISTQVQLSCRQALINPGNRLQRYFIKLMKFCEFVLPAGAMALVSYQVFIGYYESVISGNPFLGTDFVAHSILLILLCWLVPFFLHKKMQPSLKKTALSGLEKGLDAALIQTETEIEQIIINEQLENRQLHQQLEEITRSCEITPEAGQRTLDQSLDRLLID